MGKDRLEHFINQSLGDYESPIDTDELWANIQGAVPGKEAVATAGLASWKWIGLGAVALILLGGIGFYTMTGTSTEVADPSNDIIMESSVEKTPATLSENEASETIMSNQTNADITTISMESDEFVKTAELSDTKTNSSTIRNNGNGNTSASIILNNNSNNQSNNISTIISVTDESSGVSEIISIDNSEIVKAESTITTEQKSSVAGIDYSTKNKLTVDTRYLENSISLLSNDAEVSTYLGKPDRVTCPSFGNKRGGGVFIGELQLIPYYSNQIIKAEGIEGEQWKSRKEATEKYLEAFQVNLIGRYQMNNGLYFQGGIGYGQIDEKFTFNSEDVQVTFEDDLPVIIILRPNGMSDTIRGEVEVTTESTYNAETYNYHRMIELPFAIGYEFNLNNSMGLYVDAGGSINLSTFRSGYHIVDDIDVISFDNPNRPVFKSSTGFKLNGSIGLRYYTSGGVTLSVGPDVRYHISNWIGDQHPIELRYLDLGLRVGIGYAF